MTFTYTWDASWEASPTDALYGYEIDDEIRKLKIALRERLERDLIWKVGANDGLIKAHRSRISVSLNSAQSIGASMTKVLWDKEIFDALGEFASYKFVASEAGIYIVSSIICFSSMVAGKSIGLSLYKNGGVTATPSSGGTSGGFGTDIVSIFTILSLAATDYLEIYASQGDTVNRNLLSDPNSNFCIARIA